MGVILIRSKSLRGKVTIDLELVYSFLLFIKNFTTSSKPALFGFLLLSIVLLSACAQKPHKQATDPSEAPKQITLLISADSFENWEATNDVWVSDDGVIVAKKGGDDSILVSKNVYENYRLSLDFWVDKDVNSGVFVHCNNADKITPFDCYEVNIWDDHPKQEFRTGSVVAVFTPPLARVSSVGQWNTMVIEASDNELSVYVNGTLTAEIAGGERRSGFIALQRFNGGEVRFRSLQLKAL
jgi:hypothetical protein